MSPLGRWLALVCGTLFAALLVFLSPGKMLLALAAAGAAAAVIRQPRLGLLLFAFLATLMPYTTVKLGVRITLSEAMLGFTWIGAGWHLFFGRLRWHFGPTERRLAWLMLFSAVPFVAGQIHFAQADGNGLVNWVRWLLNLSTLLLVPILLDDEEAQDSLIAALLLGSLLMLLLSIGYFLKDRDATSFIPVLEKLRYSHPEAVRDIFSANYTRMASPWVHPNLTGGILVLFLPLAFFYAQARRGWRRLLGGLVALLGVAGLLFSISRGAIVSLALILLWLSWRRAPFAGRVTIFAAVLGVGLVMFHPPLQKRLATIFSSKAASTQVRVEEYRRFPEAMARYPLGIGFKVDPPPPGSGLSGISNLWLNVVYKLGIPGLLFYLAVLAAWWKESRLRGQFDRLDGPRALVLGSGAGVLAALLTGLFDHYFSFTFVLTALFWLMMGLNLHLAPAEEPAPPQPAKGFR